MRAAFFFYALYLAICLLVKYTSWFDNYDRLFWIEVTIALITVWFAWRNKETIQPVVKFNHFKWSILLGIIALSALFSWLVNISMSELNVSLFNRDISIYSGYKIYMAPVVVMVYSVALVPALFEELAFRGVLYNYLASILDERLVVMVSGFIFAAMHLSPISLVWLIPFGILLGFLRMKYNTIWYGVPRWAVVVAIKKYGLYFIHFNNCKAMLIIHLSPPALLQLNPVASHSSTPGSWLYRFTKVFINLTNCHINQL